MAITTISTTSTTTFATRISFSTTTITFATHHHSLHLLPSYPSENPPPPTLSPHRPITKLHMSSSNPTSAAAAAAIKATATAANKKTKEIIFFDGGAHYDNLLANLLLCFTLLWQPLTLAAVFKGFYLRYKFTNLRVTVISRLTGQDRSDFSYNVIKDVQVVPRFIGEWSDVIITLKDGTKVDLRSVTKFREIAKYCLAMAEKPLVLKEGGAKWF